MEILENEVIEIQTQIRLVNNAYFKFNQQRAIVQNLEEEFQTYFDALVKSKGGDTNKKYQLDMENKRIVEAPEPSEMDAQNNGSGVQTEEAGGGGVSVTEELEMGKV